MHNELLAIEQIKAMPRDAKLHLSHILRNGLCIIMGAADYQGKADVIRQVMELEKKLEEMGL